VLQEQPALARVHEVGLPGDDRFEAPHCFADFARMLERVAQIIEDRCRPGIKAIGFA